MLSVYTHTNLALSICLYIRTTYTHYVYTLRAHTNLAISIYIYTNLAVSVSLSFVCVCCKWVSLYEVATISRMLKNIGLFCKRDLQKRPIFCKETYIFKHPTHRSHPICICNLSNIGMQCIKMGVIIFVQGGEDP